MKKRVLIVEAGFAYSGAEKVLEDYVDNNDKFDFYFMFYFKGKAYEHFKSKYDNVICIDLKYNKIMLALFPFMYFNYIYKKIDSCCRDLNIKKVFFNNTLEGLLAYKYIRNNEDCIYEIHDMKATFKIPFKRFLIQKTINNCKNSVTVSEACKKSWDNKINYVVYNGLNMDKKSDNFNKENVILFIGNSTYRKGFDIFAKTAERFIENSNLKFKMIFGDFIPDYEFPKNIETFSCLERSKVYDMLNESKVLMLPARNDPFPTVILEGQLMNNIIIANNVDGIPEMVYSNEFLASDNCVDEYVDFINKIFSMSDKEISDIIIKQSEYIKKFDIKIKVKQLNQIILGESNDI